MKEEDVEQGGTQEDVSVLFQINFCSNSMFKMFSLINLRVQDKKCIKYKNRSRTKIKLISEESKTPLLYKCKKIN